jgi:hypothetical protein
MPRTPWIALAAVVSMFVIPYLPAWLFEGPRTVKHRPRRDVCADCGAPWTAGHRCLSAADIPRPLRGELRRLRPRSILARRRCGPCPRDGTSSDGEASWSAVEARRKRSGGRYRPVRLD